MISLLPAPDRRDYWCVPLPPGSIPTPQPHGTTRHACREKSLTGCMNPARALRQRSRCCLSAVAKITELPTKCDATPLRASETKQSKAALGIMPMCSGFIPRHHTAENMCTLCSVPTSHGRTHHWVFDLEPNRCDPAAFLSTMCSNHRRVA